MIEGKRRRKRYTNLSDQRERAWGVEIRRRDASFNQQVGLLVSAERGTMKQKLYLKNLRCLFVHALSMYKQMDGII